MTTVERAFRGISLRLATEYLRGLGGRVTEPTGIDPDEPIDAEDLSEPVVVAGDGWQASLTTETIEIGPSLTLTEVSIVFEEIGDLGTLDDLVDRFAQKAVRAGG
jgi:molybdopterin synthase sulfur carrier subunit